MKRWELVFFFLFPLVVKSQTITTISGTVGSVIYDPGQLAFDKFGNLYIGEALGNQVIKIDTTGLVTVFAGTGATGYGGDGGQATAAVFNQPYAVITDAFGDVYIGDAGNNRLRKVNISTGIVNTIAGTGSPGYDGDGGPASAALLSAHGMCFDNYGNLYIADYSNNRIRMINNMGIVTTIAGNGTMASTGDGGPATAAECKPDYNMHIDVSGNLYFTDHVNNTIRKINSSGIISTIAGDTTGAYIYPGDGVPALGAGMSPGAIAFNENGLLFISDYYNNRVYKIDSSGIIHTIAGNGILGSTGDGGLADTAEVAEPSGIIFDPCGNLYIAQIDNPRIRKVSFKPSCTYANVKVPEIVANQLSIYPNPFTDELNVNNVKINTNYIILNIRSIIEQQGTLKEGNNTILIPSLPPGLYLLQLTDDQGLKTIHKIIKE